MNKENLDRIVVSSNEKMGKIIMWYLDNQSWIDKMEFHPPMDTGLIILEEEGIEVKLSNTNYKLGDKVDITLEKTIPRYLIGNSEKESSGGYKGKTETFEIKNSIVITKRGK